MCTPTQGVWQPAGCVSCELVCVCVSLVRVVIICPASTHTALVSSPSLAVLHLTTYLPSLVDLCCLCLTQICAFGAYCSLSVQSQRQRPCLESVSQCCYVSGLSRDAGSIGALRRRTGRSMHALRRAVANAFPSARFIEFARVVKCNRICPSGQVKLCLS